MTAWQGGSTTEAFEDWQPGMQKQPLHLSYEDALSTQELPDQLGQTEHMLSGELVHHASATELSRYEDEGIVTPRPIQQVQPLQSCTQLISIQVRCQQPEVRQTVSRHPHA